MNESSVVVELVIIPDQVSLASELSIRGIVHNVSSTVLDTKVWMSKLLVDGQPYQGWEMAIANGLRDPREFALPPGEQVEFERVLPASFLLPEAGSHELMLEVLGVRSPSVIVNRRD